MRGVTGLPADTGELGATADIGRLRLNNSPPNPPLLSFISSTAPAVLGLLSSSKVVLSDGRAIRAEGGLAAPELITEERLPETE
jgi:hypothetical protein